MDRCEFKLQGKAIVARQYGDYAQSSGSGNAVLLMTDPDTMATIA